MTVWNCIKPFVDHKTQSKLLFVVKPTGGDMPSEITDYIDPDVIPVCVGGKYSGPLMDISTTFR
jgi:hypothetical protein